MKKWAVTAALILTWSTAAGQPQEQFRQGNTFYQQGEYRRALETYETILESGRHSSSLYFNMGNCCYKLQEIGRAVLYYEKALALATGSEDIEANLAIANLAVVDRITPLEKHLLFKIADGFVYLFPRHLLMSILGTVYLLGMILVITAVVSRRSRLKAAAVRIAAVMGVALILLLIMLAGQVHNKRNRIEAVILAGQVQVQSAPNETGAMDLFVLHEGTKVRVDQISSGWLEVVLADGKVGWIPEDAAGII